MIPTVTLGKAEEEACYRVIAPAYAGAPLSGAGAARQGGRFNRPGQEALYLSMDEATALAEYKQDNPWLPPGTICTFFIQGLRVADLSSGFEPEKWPLLWSDFSVDWRAEWFGKSPSYAYTTRAVHYGKLHDRPTSLTEGICCPSAHVASSNAGSACGRTGRMPMFVQCRFGLRPNGCGNHV